MKLTSEAAAESLVDLILCLLHDEFSSDARVQARPSDLDALNWSSMAADQKNVSSQAGILRQRRRPFEQRCSPRSKQTSCSAHSVGWEHTHIPHASGSQHLVCWSIRTLWARQRSSWGVERCDSRLVWQKTADSLTVFQLNRSLFECVKLSVTRKTKQQTLSFQPFKCTNIWSLSVRFCTVKCFLHCRTFFPPLSERDASW